MKRSLSVLSLLIVCKLAVAQPLVQLHFNRLDTNRIFASFASTVVYKPLVTPAKMLKELPKDMYTRNFGFFCKQELKMHKANVPVSVRLGSFEACDYLEQKGSGVR